jgi:hypothetical protein
MLISGHLTRWAVPAVVVTRAYDAEVGVDIARIG